ncbi:Ig-like domain-containing protein [Paenibacillus aurantius]|uniref:Ig-like domain-containing protein n=1 Tax=Paenibacillus aurantius TaxID=2918900 RepID=A0AA96LIB9_9BACL|nr:Ig-like domain-containing protein [Paenibacillus aurantius]WNQ13868.1 Ig-like domain-containing protein [Paenibacillus aurantius]
MANHLEPMIKLQPGGEASVLSYNVPEPTTYSGRNFIDLQLPDSYFIPSKPEVTINGLAASPESRAAALPTEPYNVLAASGADRLSPKLASLTPEEVAQMAEQGKKLNLYRSMTGALTYNYIDAEGVDAPVLASAPYAASGRSSLLKADDGGIVGMLPIDDDNDPDPEPDPVEISCDITSPAPNSTINGVYTGAVFDVRGSATVDYGGGSITKVLVTVGTRTAQTANLSGSSWVLPGVTVTTPGTLDITAKAYHSTGMTSLRKITVTVTIAPAPDVTLPVVKITTPSPGQIYSSGSIVVEGTASDNKGVSRVELSVDGGPLVQAESLNGWANWKKGLTLAPGNHSIVATCTDVSGNKATASLTVGVDTSPPKVTIVSPTANQQIAGTFSQGAIIEVTGTAQDAGGISLVEVSLNQNPVYVRAAEKAPGDWSQWKATFKVTEPGIHILTARCTDPAKNYSETTVAVQVTILPEVNSRLKRIILVESYRLSSYLGNYGAGRTLKTFSLLPGEKTKISVKTYTQNETTAKSASTILDSVTDEIADEFEQSMGREQTDQKKYQESFDYKVSAEAGASWGWGSASISASASGGTNAAREQFAKNIAGSTQKHVAKASARRDVQVNTSYEVKTTSSDEVSIVRDIENINVSRTLNFVFRQMNQEFITLLHLVDVRIGFYKIDMVNNVEKRTYQEVTLPQLDSLIAETIVPDKRTEVRNAIIHQLTNIFDYQDRHHRFVEEEPFLDNDGNIIPLSHYLRVKKDYTSSYTDAASGTHIEVPGIILAANRHVLRTEGIIVEALLGQGEALDNYSRDLQTETVREKELRNELLEAEMKMKRYALKILENRDETAAQLYGILNPPPKAPETKEESQPASQPVGTFA